MLAVAVRSDALSLMNILSLTNDCFLINMCMGNACYCSIFQRNLLRRNNMYIT